MRRASAGFRSFALWLGFAAATTVGCSGPATPPPQDAASDIAPALDASAADTIDFGAASDVYPAFAPPPRPHSVGPPVPLVLTNFTVVPVLYAGDTGAANVSDFVSRYAASPEWAATVAEYGVGTMTVAPTVTLTEAAPAAIADPEIQRWLLAKLDGTHPEFGATDDVTLRHTVFLLVYPSGTIVSDAPGRTSCGSFFGYHSAVYPLPPRPDAGVPDAATDDAATADAAIDGAAADGATGPVRMVPVLYTAIARCTGTGLTEAQTQTENIAHELIETATDPYRGSGYGSLDNEHVYWPVFMHGAEIADLCNVVGSFWAPDSVGYTIARAWSNAAAATFHDPCVPGPAGEPYFNSFIATTDMFHLTSSTASPTVSGVHVPIGQTRRVDVNFFSDRPTSGPWMVSAREMPVFANPPAITLAFDRSTGVNGQKVHLTIRATRVISEGVTFVMIASKLGERETVWFTPVSVR